MNDDENKSEDSISTIIGPSWQPVGFWVLYPGAPLTTKFGMYVRPTDLQIANTQQLIGWGWEDAK